MKIVVVAELMTVVLGLKTAEAVHLRRGPHLWLLVERLQQPAKGSRTLPLRARYSLLLNLKRTLDGELCSVLVNGL